MSDGKFAWTTSEQIDTMIKYNKQDASHEENNKEESQVATMTKIKDVGKKQVHSKTKKGNKSNNNTENSE